MQSGRRRPPGRHSPQALSGAGMPPHALRAPTRVAMPYEGAGPTSSTQPLRITAPADTPLRVRYGDESDRMYLVRELEGERWMRVPKQRSALEPLRSGRAPTAPGGRLLRWSIYALVAALVGGVPGMAVGLPVVFIALVRLARQAVRVRRWYRERRGPVGAAPLPAVASAESLRLWAAFWQGLLAAALGAGLLALLSGRLP